MMMKRYLAECLGTFALVFCGTGAIIINDLSGGAVTHFGIAVTFGLIVTVMIYSFGSISGAHINPAVSIAFSLTEVFSVKSVLPYLIFQFIGAILASWCLDFLFDHPTMGQTLPSGSWQQSFVLEIILTYFLMLVILMVSQNKAVQVFTAPAVGATVLLEALFAGPICGASMNPARSLAPALFSGNLSQIWIYLLAPILGAILASLTWKYFRTSN